jgi:uncharacterized protein (TIGR02996 family)
MNEQADLLRMICHHPDDDAPRLIYADWLEEQGDTEHAEFIRLSVGLAGGSHEEEKRWDAGRKFRNLEKKVMPRLLAELPHLIGIDWLPIIDRGFIARIQVNSTNTLWNHWLEVFNATPLRFINFSSLSETCIRSLRDIPVLEQIRSVEVSRFYVDSDGLNQFVRLPQFVGLTNLVLSYCPFGNTGVAHLASSPFLASLKSLDLTSSNITDDGARALLTSPYLSKLERLFIRNNPISSSLLHELRKRYQQVIS